MDDELARFLATLDDPNRWEHPCGFDRAYEVERARVFAVELERKLGTPLEMETGSRIQDASFHSQINLRGGALRFSNFGGMIALTPDHVVPDAVIEAVRRLASGHGFRLVPTDALEEDYMGNNSGVTGISTWWIRFFDWV